MRRTLLLATAAAMALAASLNPAAPASAHEGILTATIHAEMLVSGYRILYLGEASAAVMPVTNALQSLSAVAFGCAFVNHGGTRPYHIEPDCWVEDVETGTAYPMNGLQQSGNDDALATGAYALGHPSLKLCIRANVTPAPGVPEVTGAHICVPLS